MEYTYVNCHEQPEKLDKEALVNFWLKENAFVKSVDAEARAREAVIVVFDEKQEVVAVSTCFEHVDTQLGQNFLQARSFVATEHRQSGIALTMNLQLYDYFTKLFKSGEYTAAKGFVIIVESPVLKTILSKGATGIPNDPSFLYGFTREGYPKRVSWFEGAVLDV